MKNQTEVEIVCPRHQVVARVKFGSEEHKAQSPNHGCLTPCGKMDCGHFCLHPCHPLDPDHITPEFRCNQRCKRVCPRGEHHCPKICWEDCGECQALVTVPFCRHSQVKKYVKCGQLEQHECHIMLPRQMPCGHVINVFCSDFRKDIICTTPMAATLSCGHKLIFHCDESIDSYRCMVPMALELPCGHVAGVYCWERTSKEIFCTKKCTCQLECGHVCARNCHTDDPEHLEYRCQEQCIKYCGRGLHPCEQAEQHVCSEPCPPCKSTLPYMLRCGYHSVEITCSESNPDDKEAFMCQEPCARAFIDCGHPCTQLCGEICAPCEVSWDYIILKCKILTIFRRNS